MKGLKQLLNVTLPLIILLVPTIASAGDDANPGDIIINEIMQNPSAVSDTNGEWFEIINMTAAAIDINGWTVRDDDVDSHTINNGGPLTVPPGGYVVLCRNSDSGVNGGVNCDYQYSGFILANSADEVVLIDDGAVPEEIDHVNYDGGPNFPDPTGASMSYGGPGAGSPAPYIDNDVGDRWGNATSTYGAGDFGTPGAQNDDVLGPTAVTLHSITADNQAAPPAIPTVGVMIATLFSGTAIIRRRKRREARG